jgi:hypothetical protein
MIAGRNHMCAEVEEQFGMFLRDTFPFGRVLAVDNQTVYMIFLDETRHEIQYKVESGFADDIADKKQIESVRHF